MYIKQLLVIFNMPYTCTCNDVYTCRQFFIIYIKNTSSKLNDLNDEES